MESLRRSPRRGRRQGSRSCLLKSSHTHAHIDTYTQRRCNTPWSARITTHRAARPPGAEGTAQDVSRRPWGAGCQTEETWVPAQDEGYLGEAQVLSFPWILVESRLNSATPPSCSRAHPCGRPLEPPARAGDSALSQGTAQAGQGAESIPSVPGVLYPRSAQGGPSEQGPCGFETWLPGSTAEVPCVKRVGHGTPQGKPGVNTLSPQNFCFLRV